MTPTQGPVVCAVIGRTRHRMAQVEIQEAAKRGAKLIELRLDYLAKAPDYKRLLANRPCPLIATIRRPDDGGRWKGTEDERLMLLRQAIVAGFDYIDLEIDTAQTIRRFGKVKRIVSYHNFRETPDNLEELYQQMCGLDADIVKLAVTPQKTADNLRVLKLLQNAQQPTVALAMGELGNCTRVLNAKYGCPFSYATFNPDRAIAPGMISFKDLKHTYRYEEINPDTRVFGVIGDPVGHSLSPLIHNGAFRHLGIDAVYVPFRVPRGELVAFLDGFKSIPVAGVSVTIPHKEGAAKYGQPKDLAVEKTGAANTLVFHGGGCDAHNTDLQAAIGSLKSAIDAIAEADRTPLEKRTVLLLGAGGVARSIAFGLAAEGCALTITNRTPERAQKLASEVRCRTVDWAGRHGVVCDTVVNCTSVGMHPNLDECPLHNSFLRPGMLIFDTIYTPETTMLLREAESRGCHTLTGVDMFVRQAALQFKLFTGRDAPIDVMTTLVRRALSPVNYAKNETSTDGPAGADE